MYNNICNRFKFLPEYSLLGENSPSLKRAEVPVEIETKLKITPIEAVHGTKFFIFKSKFRNVRKYFTSLHKK